MHTPAFASLAGSVARRWRHCGATGDADEAFAAGMFRAMSPVAALSLLWPERRGQPHGHRAPYRHTHVGRGCGYDDSQLYLPAVTWACYEK